MNNSSAGFNPDMRVSPKIVIATLLALSWALILLSQSLVDPVKMESLAVLTTALSVAAWFLESRNTRLGRWFIVATLTLLVLLVHYWLRLPNALAWLAVPTALAAVLLNLASATGTVLGEAILLILLSPGGPGGIDWASIGVAMGSNLAILGVMFAAYQPVHNEIAHSEAYFDRAQVLLEQARDRKAELEQALADLASANRQLALASERMAVLRTIAEEAQKAKTIFVAKVSHEFRTPLNMIIGLVSLMVETPEMYDVILPPEMSSDLEVVHRNCVHLANMVNDVLSLTQMEAGRLVLHKEQIDLRQLINSAVAAVHPLAEKKELSLKVEVPDGLPQVYCDATRIQQVILNLVSNAARFTVAGGITVHVEHEDQRVVVSVIDTGPGISAEDVEMIFEPFCQGSGDIWREKGGTGLGLSISKQFVQLHGGRMWLESELGVGSSFMFELPVSPPVGHIARPGYRIREDWMWRERAFLRADQARIADELAKPRLVVCDENGALYSQFAGYGDQAEFIEAHDLDGALEALQQCPAHALVLNAAVPENLWAQIERIRAQIPDTPIVGCSVRQSMAHALEAGATGYLTKPVTRAQLDKAIQNLGKPIKQVLIVDDDPDVLRLFTRMLHVCDSTISVVTASSGEQALEMARSDPPDLVLLDVVMSGMNGWQVLDRLRGDGSTAEIPVLFVSAQDLVERAPESQLLVTALGEGLSISQLLQCSVTLPDLLLTPESKPGREPPRTVAARSVSTGAAQPPGP
ncbi:MAG: response regulator [Anaerolineae bacterium]|nr:response regulator [Anaerolineae bacterium]